ncbi:MAG: hypothetical protein BME94_00860 [Methanobacteriales archaeon Met13]
MKLCLNELKTSDIVFITVDGGPHYSVVREMTNESVKLSDPSLGNIEMTREKFNEVYSENALVVSDPSTIPFADNSITVNDSTDQASNQTNQTNDNTTTQTSSDSQSHQTDNRTNHADM